MCNKKKEDNLDFMSSSENIDSQEIENICSENGENVYFENGAEPDIMNAFDLENEPVSDLIDLHSRDFNEIEMLLEESRNVQNESVISTTEIPENEMFSEADFDNLSEEESIEIKINDNRRNENIATERSQLDMINSDFEYASDEYYVDREGYTEIYDESSDSSVVIQSITIDAPIHRPNSSIVIDLPNINLTIERTAEFLDYIIEFRRKQNRHNEEFYSEKIKSLKKQKFEKYLQKNKQKQRQNDCLICLEKFKRKNFLYFLPCDHFYHKKCISSWLQTNDSCPICRKNVIESRKRCFDFL